MLLSKVGLRNECKHLMTTMHPSLEDLVKRYNEVAGQMRSGTKTKEDAKLILMGLTATDAVGTMWRIKPSTGALQAQIDGQWIDASYEYFSATDTGPSSLEVLRGQVSAAAAAETAQQSMLYAPLKTKKVEVSQTSKSKQRRLDRIAKKDARHRNAETKEETRIRKEQDKQSAKERKETEKKYAPQIHIPKSYKQAGTREKSDLEKKLTSPKAKMIGGGIFVILALFFLISTMFSGGGDATEIAQASINQAAEDTSVVAADGKLPGQDNQVLAQTMNQMDPASGVNYVLGASTGPQSVSVWRVDDQHAIYAVNAGNTCWLTHWTFESPAVYGSTDTMQCNATFAEANSITGTISAPSEVQQRQS